MAKYDINLRDYWRIIRKRRTIVILSTVLFTVFSYLFALIRTPEPLYEATSAVKVEKASDFASLLLGTVSWTHWDNVATQAVIITSFPVMEAAARQMGLIPANVSSVNIRNNNKYLRVVTNLKSQVQTAQEGNTNIINITATSAKGKDAAKLANTVAEVFRQNNLEERNKKVRETREFIEGQLEVVKGRLREAENNLRNFEESSRLVSIDDQTAAALNRLVNLENELADLQQRRVEVRRQLGLIQQFKQGKLVDKEAFYMEDPHPQLEKLTANFRDLSLRREILLNDFTEEHPQVSGVDAELQNVIGELDKELRSMLTTMGGRHHDLEMRLEAVRAETMSLPEGALTVTRLRRDVDVNADLFSQLKSKYQEALIQESGLIEEVKIIKPALEPNVPINMPDTTMNTVTGAVIGLVVGLVLALIVETMDTSLGTIEDVEEILGIPVLGVIPSVEKFVTQEKGKDATKLETDSLVTHFNPRSPVSEAYRSLRTNLQFLRMDKKARILLITSSSLQEGKTYNVVNLSLSLAQAGEKVLLVDADLRRPAVHRIFGLKRQPGLTDYIMEISDLNPGGENGDELGTTYPWNSGQGNGSWQNVTNTITDVMLGDFGIDNIFKTPGLDNLHMINAGQGLLNPAEILRSPKFKEFLQEVREHYDVVIVDTPPVLPVADAFEVAPQVDGVILVYEVGRIGRGILHRAKVQLEQMNSNVLGVILNNVKPDVAPDFYRYRTDYYYREEDGNERLESSPPPRDVVAQTMQAISGNKILAKLTEAKRLNILILIGLMLLAGFLWQSYPPELLSSAQKSVGVKPKLHTSTTSAKTKPKMPPETSGAKHRAGLVAVSSKSDVKTVMSGVEQIPDAESQEQTILAVKKAIEVPELVSPQSMVAKESNKGKEPTSLQDQVQIFESLPRLAKIRSEPDIHALVLHRVRKGTRLRVVGREGNWLKLKLRNGNTGWIYHSLAQGAE